jgi:16S rRNA (guanine966-N2)-methyltransferase
MRVIAGLYKGRILKTVNDLSVRPATDRVKQTLFDMLASRVAMEGAHVLDLFAGSGSLGIEALSRGADHVTFVETNPDATEYIERNVEALGCGAQVEIVLMDAMHYLRETQEHFSLIFADPPYGFEETPSIPSVTFTDRRLTRHGYLLIEHASNLAFQSTPLYHAGPMKKFGRTIVTLFHYPRQEEIPS